MASDQFKEQFRINEEFILRSLGYRYSEPEVKKEEEEADDED